MTATRAISLDSLDEIDRVRTELFAIASLTAQIKDPANIPERTFEGVYWLLHRQVEALDRVAEDGLSHEPEEV